MNRAVSAAHDSPAPERTPHDPSGAGYCPPPQLVLRALGLTAQDLESSSVTISVFALKRLLSEVLTHVSVDERWYADRYPDVHAATLAGDIASPAAHFKASGYLEGRLPTALAFDPLYYFATYPDLATVFDASDTAGLRRHFETKGYFEGRAGIAAHFADAQRWRSAAGL
jgi:hypothetical protein